MSTPYRIVLRDLKTKLMLKKRVYTSLEDYIKYKNDLIKRYKWQGYVVVETLRDNKWCQLAVVQHECPNWTKCDLH